MVEVMVMAMLLVMVMVMEMVSKVIQLTRQLVRALLLDSRPDTSSRKQTHGRGAKHRLVVSRCLLLLLLLLLLCCGHDGGVGRSRSWGELDS